MKTSQTHQKIVGLLNGRQTRKVGNNTYAEKRLDGSVALRLHSTDILVAREDGTVLVNSGGWRTVTTKARLNDYLADGLRLHQSKGVWFWSGDQVYADGDIINRAGRVDRRRGCKAGAAKPMAVKDAAKLTRQITKFACVCALEVGKIPMPGSGDCWYCSMRDKATGKSLGDVSHNVEHLYSHMEEGYVVPSLVLEALTEANATDYIKSRTFKRPDDSEPTLAPSMMGFAHRHVQVAVRNFMKRRLGLAAPGGWGNVARKDGLLGTRVVS